MRHLRQHMHLNMREHSAWRKARNKCPILLTATVCSCSTDEREQSRVQRLLMEGMKIVYEHSRPVADEYGVEEEGDKIGEEVYGHLAAALRPQMVTATDERLATLTSNRFISTTALAFTLGAGGAQRWHVDNVASSSGCIACGLNRLRQPCIATVQMRLGFCVHCGKRERCSAPDKFECQVAFMSSVIPAAAIAEQWVLQSANSVGTMCQLGFADPPLHAARQGMSLALLAAQRLPEFRSTMVAQEKFLRVMIKTLAGGWWPDEIGGRMVVV